MADKSTGTMKYPVPSAIYHDYIPPRDFVGYGNTTVENPWPNNAKIVVSFCLNFEEGGELTPWNGDPDTEQSIHELCFHRQPIHGGKRDPVVESLDQYEYGIRQGLPRILRVFKQYNATFTTWAVGRSLEVNADPYAKLLVQHGHEIADHGNRWKNARFSGPDEDAENIRKGIQRLQAATGDPTVPAGYFIATRFASHVHTRAKVQKEMAVPLLYSSDDYLGDLPRYVPHPLTLDGEPDEGLLMIPYSLINNDYAFLRNGQNSFSTAQQWLDLLKGDFDMLYEEGKNGAPKMMTVALHNRIVGKPGRIIALQRFFEYITSKPDVWIANRRDIAKHWRERFPYDKVGPTREYTTKFK